jgi:hypothetical protein
MFKRILIIFGYVVAGIVIAILLSGIIKETVQRTSDKKSLVIGETYQIEGPYPATLKVLGFSDSPYFGVVNGDMTIILPNGSKDPLITRIHNPGYNDCRLYVQFTSPEGITQTETWESCSTLKSLTVVPDEIYVSVKQ